MEIFEDIEMEFFDPMITSPEGQEEVIVILKDGEDACNKWRHAPVKGIPFMVYCTFRENRTVPSKYMDRTGYLSRSYTKSQIKCWGRLKRL